MLNVLKIVHPSLQFFRPIIKMIINLDFLHSINVSGMTWFSINLNHTIDNKTKLYAYVQFIAHVTNEVINFYVILLKNS